MFSQHHRKGSRAQNTGTGNVVAAISHKVVNSYSDFNKKTNDDK